MSDRSFGSVNRKTGSVTRAALHDKEECSYSPQVSGSAAVSTLHTEETCERAQASYPDARGRLRVEPKGIHSRSPAKWALGIMTAAQHAGSSREKNSVSDPDSGWPVCTCSHPLEFEVQWSENCILCLGPQHWYECRCGGHQLHLPPTKEVSHF